MTETLTGILVRLKGLNPYNINRDSGMKRGCLRSDITTADRYHRPLRELFPPLIIGTLRSKDADGNENVKKQKVLISKTTTLHEHHAFLYISFLFLHDFDVKMPNLAF